MPYARTRIVTLGTIPVITVVLAVFLLLAYSTDYTYEPRVLLGLASTVFMGVLPLVVAAYAARAFLRFGSFNVLMLGCGTLALGWASLIAGWVMGLPGSPNHTVTVHNIGALLGGSCHFLSGSEAVRKKFDEIEMINSLGNVVIFYLLMLAVPIFVATASLADMTPTLFVSGPEGGPTSLRQYILLAAVILYAVSAVRFVGTYRRSGEIFFYWYALALLLIAIGLGAFFLQKSVGSLIGWTGRISQYLAGFYFLLVVYEAMRSAKRKGFSAEKSMSFFFTAAERNYRALLESVNDAVFCCDRGFHVFLCNSKAEVLLGRPGKEILGSAFADFFQSEKQELLTALRNLERGEEAQGCLEACMVRSDGRPVPVEFSISRQGSKKGLSFVAVVRDITARRHMEEALRQSKEELVLRVAERTKQLAELNEGLGEEIKERRQVEIELRERKERFQTLFMSMAQGAFYQDRDGRLTEMNASALEIFGLTKEQFLARDSFSPQWKVINEDGSMLPPEEHPSMIALRKGVPVREKIAGVFNPKTGEYVWVVINALPQFREGVSEPVEVFVTLHDITRLKWMERELRKSRDELEKRVEERTHELQKTYDQLLHAEKLSAMGSLSASIAHEFNNPLQSVMTVIKGLSYLPQLGEQEKSLMGMAIQECERMRDLIGNMQDFNRPTSGQRMPTDLHSTIDSILLLGKYRHKRTGISIVKEYASALPPVNAVADQVKQVMLNLVNNAVDACEEGGGTITVGTSVDDDGNVRIAVRDTGKGIPPEILSRVFEPFVTTKPADKGTGLGLSVSRSIVKRHGGRITVSSEPGKGSVFTVILPIAGHHQSGDGLWA